MGFTAGRRDIQLTVALDQNTHSISLIRLPHSSIWPGKPGGDLLLACIAARCIDRYGAIGSLTDSFT